MRVLIVDDYPDTAELVDRLLTSEGHECRSTTSGGTALAAAEAFKPDVAIIDMALQDIDGYALRVVLRRRLPDHTPFFIAMSTRTHALKAALAVGFDACLLKPATGAQFLRAVGLARNARPGLSSAEHL
ncbi:MAG TPA: response regulator [Kofleriaceae bacterium]|jgi:CheY-like chemotaxis protein|nr:response regulator [Kofleriaceae bacterium]